MRKTNSGSEATTSSQPISFIDPLSRAFERMKSSLFRPFSLKTWFVLGFTAWLANLAQGGNKAGGSAARDPDLDDFEIDGIGEAFDPLWERLVANTLVLSLVALGCVVLIVLVLTVLWLSSRGKFMFLDNVVHGRALVADPWRRFARHGNSLFVFRLIFTVVSVLLVGVVVLTVSATVGLSVLTDFETFASVGIALTGLALFALLIFAIIYAAFFLNAFVVPLMHRYDLDVIDGWRRFLEIFAARPVPLLVCGFFYMVLLIGAGIAIVAGGLLTCCIGFLFMVIPYIGTVVLLPISVVLRAFTLEFLAQFDGELLPSAVTPTAEL